MAGAFDGAGQGALVFRTGACLAARTNFAIIRDVTPQNIYLFVINDSIFICTELAFTRA